MIRKATVLDLPAVKEIYNYAVLNTTATYDINPKDDKYFVDMLNEHTGKYLLSVYEENGNVIGYVALSRYSKRDAYDITAELSVYVKTIVKTGTSALNLLSMRFKRRKRIIGF